MKKTLICSAVAALAASAPLLSHADDAPAPFASPVAFNVGVVSDYRYRGISQSRVKPALQGGIDYSGPGGIYLGTWASTIKWIKDALGDANIELDLYGGWKGDVGAGLTLDVGALSYVYHKAVTPAWTATPWANPNTTELYGALSYNIATLKYSHSLTDLFGNVDSKSSGYLELAAAFDAGNGFSVTPHVGHQRVKGPFADAASYTDYALTVGKDFGNGMSGSIAIVSTDADKAWYVSLPTAGSKELGKAGAIVGLKYTF
jgi:uncharacterized protein (TIGR02001 family)